MKNKTSYSAKELEEFKKIIEKKIQLAQNDLSLLKVHIKMTETMELMIPPLHLKHSKKVLKQCRKKQILN